MRVMIIGASGHIGSALAVRLVRDGHEVIALSRGRSYAYGADYPEWKQVNQLVAERGALCENGKLLADLRPDVVCDMLAYNAADARMLCRHLEGRDIHLLQVGTNWVFGHRQWVPVTEEHPRTEPSGYGRDKAEAERYLMELHAAGHLRCTVIHPGHVTGPGWVPINPQGNADRAVYQAILDGEELLLPGDGMATLQHVHAQDVAGVFSACIARPQQSGGQSFLATAPDALTLRGFAEMLCDRFGREPKLRFVDREHFLDALPVRLRGESAEHIRHSPVCSMEKARDRLEFVPRFRCFEAVMHALDWQVRQGLLKV